MALISPASAVGTAVHSVIREAGLNLKAYSEKADEPRRTITRRVNGHTCFTFAELIKVAEVTGTSVAEITERAERILARGMGAA